MRASQKTNHDKEDLLREMVLLAAIATCFFFIGYANLCNFCEYMESDIGAEVEMAGLLSSNHFLQPSTWVHSTHGYMITTSNLAAVFYSINGNLNLSMGLSCTVFTILFSGMGYLFYRKIHFSRVAALLGVLLPLVLTTNIVVFYKTVALYAGYYSCYILILFLVLFFYADIIQNNRVAPWIWIVSLILAVITGIQSMHAVIFIWLPVFATEFIRLVRNLIGQYIFKKKGSFLKIHISSMLWSFSTLAICLILNKCATSYGSDTSRNFRNSMAKLWGEIIPEVAGLFSIDISFLIVTIIMIVSVIGIFFLVKSEDTRWSTIPVLFSFAVPVFGATFTTMDSAGRYYIMIIFIIAMGFFFFYDMINRNMMQSNAIKNIMIIFAIVLTIISMRSFYCKTCAESDYQSSDEYQAVNWIMENGYTKGYTTWEYAANMTVLSNNNVLIASVADMKDMCGCKWLTDTSWYPPVAQVENETVYIVPDECLSDFDIFVNEKNPKIIQQSKFGNLSIFVTNKDYSFWEG